MWEYAINHYRLLITNSERSFQRACAILAYTKTTSKERWVANNSRRRNTRDFWLRSDFKQSEFASLSEGRFHAPRQVEYWVPPGSLARSTRTERRSTDCEPIALWLGPRTIDQLESELTHSLTRCMELWARQRLQCIATSKNDILANSHCTNPSEQTYDIAIEQSDRRW